MSKFSILIAIVSALCAFSNPALAQSVESEAPETGSKKKNKLSIRGGLKGGLMSSIVEGVPENETIDDQLRIDPDLYPMFGLGGAFGLNLEARYQDVVALETGLLWTGDNGKGHEDINFTGGSVREYQEQKTLRGSREYLLP